MLTRPGSLPIAKSSALFLPHLEMTESRPSCTARIEFDPANGVHLEVWLPSAPVSSPVPVLIWLHGGGTRHPLATHAIPMLTS